MKIRKSQERGHANHGWLDSYHSFSFAQYYDPAHMQYSVLRVINEDVIAPAMGFGMHPHRDMEIVTYMLQGELQHKDSLGNGSVIRAGDVQRMTAGTGIVHSEFNASTTEPAHLLQIWLLPERNSIVPGYEEKHFDAASKHNQWRLIASPDSSEGSLKIHQDVFLYATQLDKDAPLNYALKENRSAYIQVARGSVTLNGAALVAGDAVAIDSAQNLELLANESAELLLFDLPPNQSGEPKTNTLRS
ncbi:pirin family protein [Methyloradius palustris]|uniref:Quercetin 2,3-dioxygenase n=1 Tax=Methyloradius palustris TaxID=2778876 RepID=A0A8D5JW19_9PROT|nr:pirin family protein [Methyloradius palustris]BCM24644.1 quercetin 2,3-dioxygenase [Methyloradius palustris]